MKDSCTAAEDPVSSLLLSTSEGCVCVSMIYVCLCLCVTVCVCVLSNTGKAWETKATLSSDVCASIQKGISTVEAGREGLQQPCRDPKTPNSKQQRINHGMTM